MSARERLARAAVSARKYRAATASPGPAGAALGGSAARSGTVNASASKANAARARDAKFMCDPSESLFERPRNLFRGFLETSSQSRADGDRRQLGDVARVQFREQ